MNSLNRRMFWTAMGLALFVAACSSEAPQQSWSGPKMLASVTLEDATPASPKGTIIRTTHYKIYSTVQDRPDFLNRTGQLMEGAFDAYRLLVPQIPPTDYPLQCYIFADRVQWADFTKQHTGVDSSIYLQISRGGYTIHDWYVAYFIGDVGTYSVAAHEGWHQFVNRHFRGRLPPFLEEGLACMFENVEWGGDLPRWNLSVNPARTISLRKALSAKVIYPLPALVVLHAGQVVNQSPIKVEAFYAQAWAFARYLWEGENGKYRAGLRRLLADTADGTVYDPTGSHRRSYLPWNPAGVRPMLEHYLGENLTVTDQGYQRFIRDIAFNDRDQAEPSP